MARNHLAGLSRAEARKDKPYLQKSCGLDAWGEYISTEAS